MKTRLLCLLTPALALAAVLTAWVQSSAGSTSSIPRSGEILDQTQLAHASGALIYQHICQACHMADAEGAAGAGHIPALARDARLVSAEYMAAIVLNGRGDMPGFRPRPDFTGFDAMSHTTLSDAQIAAAINFVRSHFGNHYRDRITPAEVKALRTRTSGLSE
jgi:mono/diheme cytochrome c family protein